MAKDANGNEIVDDPSLMQQAAEAQARDNASALPASTTTTTQPDTSTASTTSSTTQPFTQPATTPGTVTPDLVTFDEGKSTAGRVKSIIDEDSPLMMQAATKGTQAAAARGLTNSSLAAEASQNAVLTAATPIASNDASLYQQAQLANQQTKLSADTTNANLKMEADKLNAQKEQFAQSLGISVQDLDLRRETLSQQDKQFLDDLNMRQKTLEQNKAQFDADQAQKLVVTNLEIESKKQLADIEAQYKADIQNNTNISQAWGTMMTNISAIQNNPDMKSDTKTTLINNTLAEFAAYAAFWKKASGTDAPPVDDLLNFGPPGAPAPAPAPGAAPAPPPGIQPVPPNGKPNIQPAPAPGEPVIVNN